jgi:hypothetical protein
MQRCTLRAKRTVRVGEQNGRARLVLATAVEDQKLAMALNMKRRPITSYTIV